MEEVLLFPHFRDKERFFFGRLVSVRFCGRYRSRKIMESLRVERSKEYVLKLIRFNTSLRGHFMNSLVTMS